MGRALWIKRQREHYRLALQRRDKRAHKMTGEQVVILVNEYDKPLLCSITDETLQENYRSLLQSFYSVIKTCDPCIRFAFKTGITRFSKLNIFSGINNLNDITTHNDYSTLCGIMDDELHTYLDNDIEEMGAAYRHQQDDNVLPSQEIVRQLSFHVQMSGRLQSFQTFPCARCRRNWQLLV